MTESAPKAPSPLRYAAPLAGLATGCIAVLVQTRFAPVGLFPLLIGIVTGGAVAAALSLAGGGGLRLRFLSATAAALLAVGAAHFGSYLQAKAAADEEIKTLEQMQHSFPQANVMQNLPRPVGGFSEYVRRELDIGRKLGPLPVDGALLILWWIVDGLLVWVGATVTALLLGVQPVAAAPASTSPTSGESA